MFDILRYFADKFSLALAVSCLSLVFCEACRNREDAKPSRSSCRYAEYFDIAVSSNNDSALVIISPYSGKADTVSVSRPVSSLIAMSTSYIGYINAIGCDSIISGVSGIGFVSDSSIIERYNETKAGNATNPVFDIGPETSPDYERVVSLAPDLFVTYSVSANESPSIAKLGKLGVNVMQLSEYLEPHPLARAEYIRLFGFLTGRMRTADSVFNEVCRNYESLVQKDIAAPKKVLLNAPYGDQWFIPGGDNYISRLIRDAGGVVLGSENGKSGSMVVPLEEVYTYFKKADFWLNTGVYTNRRQLFRIHPAFSGFREGGIYNNTLRTTPNGGNDFWESGAVRPDLVIEDLVEIFSGRGREASLNYYIEVE